MNYPSSSTHLLASSSQMFTTFEHFMVIISISHSIMEIGVNGNSSSHPRLTKAKDICSMYHLMLNCGLSPRLALQWHCHADYPQNVMNHQNWRKPKHFSPPIITMITNTIGKCIEGQTNSDLVYFLPPTRRIWR